MRKDICPIVPKKTDRYLQHGHRSPQIIEKRKVKIFRFFFAPYLRNTFCKLSDKRETSIAAPHLKGCHSGNHPEKEDPNKTQLNIKKSMKKKLVLESGEVFIGKGFGAEGETTGEVVFNTAMTGYQELFSDPSFYGQIVCLTYPLIGNYGINRDDHEAIEPAIRGLIVKEVCDFPSNFRSEMTLDEFFKQKNLVGISDIDTRRLTRLLRSEGVRRGKIVDVSVKTEEVTDLLKNTPPSSGLVKQASAKVSYACPARGLKVVLVDFGSKFGVLRNLRDRNCDVTVVPYHTTAEEILRMNPDGVLLSNGPGDPKDISEAPDLVRGILGKIPVFGICLGHQLIALACGAETFKLKYGHRGANHPVIHIGEDRTLITSQNHGYAVRSESLRNTDLEETFVALNDGTNEGVRHTKYPCFSVQFHPEAAPGPNDSNFLFDDFLSMMENFKRQKTITEYIGKSTKKAALTAVESSDNKKS